MVESLPSVRKIAGGSFQLQRLDAWNPARNGNHQGVELGEPLWSCRIETTALGLEQAGDYKWLIAKLNGPLNMLYMFDPMRLRPFAYAEIDDNLAADALIGRTARRIGLTTRRIGISFFAWGAPRIVSMSRANGTMTFEGFSAGAVITNSDMGHWDDGVARRLHILEGGTADASGRVTLECRPHPPADSSRLPAAFEMNEPCAEFCVLKPDVSFSAPHLHHVSLEAIQRIRSND